MLSGITSSYPSLFQEVTGTPGGSPSTIADQGSTFSDAFKSALQGVDDLQGNADTQVGELMNGAAHTDVNHVMVSVEKADVAFQLMMQVRNKVVSAYQDIEKMQF